jgi:hypothetical protein
MSGEVSQMWKAAFETGPAVAPLAGGQGVVAGGAEGVSAALVVHGELSVSGYAPVYYRTWAECYQTFYGLNLQMFLTS